MDFNYCQQLEGELVPSLGPFRLPQTLTTWCDLYYIQRSESLLGELVPIAHWENYDNSAQLPFLWEKVVLIYEAIRRD